MFRRVVLKFDYLNRFFVEYEDFISWANDEVVSIHISSCFVVKRLQQQGENVISFIAVCPFSILVIANKELSLASSIILSCCSPTIAAVMFMGIMNILVLNWILPCAVEGGNRNNVMQRCYPFKLWLFYTFYVPLLSSSHLG